MSFPGQPERMRKFSMHLFLVSFILAHSLCMEIYYSENQ